MKKITLFLSLVFLVLGQLSAQITDTIQVYSSSMKKEIPNIIILPESYTQQPQTNYPVVYLLHGYGGNYSTWSQKTKPDLAKVASGLGLIIVCPDGANSWYWDSPVNPASQYETYVSRELVEYIDKNYRTIPSRKGRAITGFSMGGHGGLWLGFRHPNIYGACGSMSGGVDIRPFPNNWDMKNSIGNYAENTQRWDEHTVINLIPFDPQQDPLAIIIDCGTEDFFYNVNQALHEKLLNHKIPHDYIIRPGKHNNEYWNNAIDYQLLFFKKELEKLNIEN